MEEQKIIVEQYRAYIDSKDKFVERSFAVNRFYIILTLVLGFITVFFKQQSGIVPAALAVFAALGGIAVTSLWWLNQDAYAYLIKIKLGDVLEEIEKSLPVKPHCLEYLAIKRRTEEKKAIVFADVQKTIALTAFSAFFAYALYDGGKLIIATVFQMTAW